MRRTALTLLAGLIGALPLVAVAQVGSPDQTYRVFLIDGETLPAYGDYAVVGDRIVFSLPIGTVDSAQRLQLMSLPVASVDLDRTERYAYALKAARYAATRGEADYLAMTDEVSRTLEDVRQTVDPARRLAMAEQARARLLAWSGASYAYRADDIRQLTGLFDQVIGELRAAAGQSAFTLDLSSGLPTPRPEPLLPVPTFGQSIEHALDAARVADIADERMAILRSAEEVAVDSAAPTELRSVIAAEIDAELVADREYAALEADLMARAEAALDAGDVDTVQALRGELLERDQALGARRPQRMAALRSRMVDLIEHTIAHRLALDRYALARAGRLDYERIVRPVMSGLDGLRPTLLALREQSGTAFWRLERAIDRVAELEEDLRSVEAPDDLADVHATLSSALLMAREACARWRRFVITTTSRSAEEASTAAAASLMLATRMREDLVTRLFPPKAR